MKSVKHLLFVPVICLVTLFVISCQREATGDLPREPEPLPGGADSTRLIKKLSYYFYSDDGSFIRDSVIEDYSYDTVNRTITINWHSSDLSFTDRSGILSYNADGMLMSATFTFVPGHIPERWDPASITFTYDNEKILQQVKMTSATGETETRVFQKTSLGNGEYQLEYDQTEPGFPVIFHHLDKFDASRRPYYTSTSHTYETGMGMNTALDEKTIVYDADGSAIRAEGRYSNTIDNSSEDYLEFEFSGRETKGSELYQQRLLLFGQSLNFEVIAESDPLNGALGILSLFPDGHDAMEYSKYPIKSAKVFTDGQMKTFEAASEFDTLGRLISFKAYTDDGVLIPHVYKITYYK